MPETTDTKTNVGDTKARSSEVALDAMVGQVWENVTTLERLQLRSVECGCYLVFECLPSRMLSNRCCYSEDSWRALVGQGHYRLLPDSARESLVLPNEKVEAPK